MSNYAQDPSLSQNPQTNTSSAGAQAAPYEGTGTSQYGNNIESTTSGTAGQHGTSHGGGVKGIAAAVHGAGEKIRGTFNKGVDAAAGEDAGVAKNSKIASDGDNEINSGNFSTATKNREGALPGSDYQARHAQANTDLNRE